jgi:ferredoxin-NADP reductase
VISSKEQFDNGPVSVTLAEFETDVVVAEKKLIAAGVVRLTLRDSDGRDLPHWSPGAHLDLIFKGGMIRQYSLCGDRKDRSAWQIAVLGVADGRGGSRYLHESVEPGHQLRVRGPRNHFALKPSPNYLFIAGGIGITPILPMIAQAQERGSSWRLLYGGRSLESMAFTAELTELAKSSDGAGRVGVCPQDTDGLLDLDSELGRQLADTLVYCCGPEPLLEAVEGRCAAWEPSALHVERFGRRDVADSEPALEEFEVELSRSGDVLHIPAERSIFEVLEQAGVDVFSSCLEGICGSCETAVLGGTPDHRDSVLSPEDQQAGKYMMICVSRSRTPRLVLDL